MRAFSIALIVLLCWPLGAQHVIVGQNRRVLAPGYFAQDTFTDAGGTPITSHTPEIGGSWSLHGSSGCNGAAAFQINTGNALHATVSDASTIVYNNGVPPNANYSVQAQVHTATASSNVAAGPAGRIQTGSCNLYGVFWYYTYWYLGKWVNGNRSSLGTYTGDAPNTTRTVQLKMTGTSVQVYVDGNLRIDATDSDISGAGRAGVAGVYAESSSWLDNLQAR